MSDRQATSLAAPMQVFYTSPWIPPEWIAAHELEPRGIWSADGLWRESLPLAAGVCAFAEAVLGFTKVHPNSAVIFTTSCDQMRRGFDMLSGAGASRAFLFNLPATWQSPTARQIYRSELDRLGRFLKALGGCAPSPTALRRAVAERNSARHRLLTAAPSCPSVQFAEAVVHYHWDGSATLPEQTAVSGNAVPLAILGGPLPASPKGLIDIMEAAGGRVALNATEAGERSLLPPLDAGGAEGDPGAALARGYFDNIVDVFQRPNTRLYAWLEPRLRTRQIRGIVLWLYTGCDLWRAEAKSLREAFGLPVLLLDADETRSGSPRDAGRLQAFIETLR